MSADQQGLYPIPLDEMLAGSNAAPAAGNLRLIGAGGVAYALYAVINFDGDCSPESALVTTAGVAGQYYLAFGDYSRESWSFTGPFAGDSEAAIPNPDGRRLAEAFVSPLGACSLAVVAAAGSDVTITGIELSVGGGAQRPDPPGVMQGSGAAPGYLLTWTPSADYACPDFAGYFVERAPQLLGAFTALDPAPVSAAFITDAGAADGVQYRYRVCAADSAGNLSDWTTFSGGPQAGEAPNPVVLMDFPQQLFVAPAEIEFDLSASFDPAGTGIASYELDFGGLPATIAGDAPVISAVLQPGCYQITARAFSADDPPRVGSGVWRLNVLPDWQQNSVLVSPATAPGGGGLSRLQFMRGLRLPASGEAVLLGVDRAAQSLMWVRGSGTAMQQVRLPLYADCTFVGEPVACGDGVFAPFTTGDGIYLAGLDGLSAQCWRIGERSAAEEVAVASDGERLWLLFTADSGSYDLCYTLLNGPAESGVIVSGIGGLQALDAVYSTAAGALQIAYSDTDSVEWLRWDVAARTITASSSPAALVAHYVDLELLPGGQPAVLYSSDGRHRYSEQDAEGNWLTEELVDDTDVNYSPTDLLITSGAVLSYFASGSGQAHLYSRTAPGTWNQHGAVSFSADSAYEVALLAPADAGTDLADVADAVVGGDVQLAALHALGSDSIIWTLPGACGQGTQLRAAAATDGLHAVWRNSVTQQSVHYVSNDGGASWTDAGELGAFESLDLAATADGALYISGFDGTYDILAYWNGAAWEWRWYAESNADLQPFINHDLQGPASWVRCDPWTNIIHFVSGTETDGFGETTAASSAAPLWEGALAGGMCFTLTGGEARDAGWLGSYGFGSGTAQLLSDVQPDAPLDLLGQPATRGRQLGAMSYYIGTDGALAVSGFSCGGASSRPLRYDSGNGMTPAVSELPLGQWLQLADPEQAYSRDARRTLGCAQAASRTAVVLLTSWDGTEGYFAWSNFGNWQELPLPSALSGMAAAEVLVGRDGRWHILYKDPATDDLRCISSAE